MRNRRTLALERELYFYTIMHKRVNFYIDGFNFYFGLKSKNWKAYYWLDIVKFCERFLRPGQSLENVYYFTATQKAKSKKDRQDLFFSANKLNPKFKLVFGKFLKKQIYTPHGIINTFEEKQTDVNIAVHMIKNVVFDKNDISVLVSGDSDLVPPIDFIRELNPSHKIFCYFPPNRVSVDLMNSSDNYIKLARYEHRFKKSMLPESITLDNGYIIKRPDKWK